MKEYNYVQGLIFVFFSKEFYRDVMKRWQGKGFLYAAFILPIVILPMSFQALTATEKFSNVIVPVIKQAPGVWLHDGVLEIDRLSPHAIRIPGPARVKLLIDTSDKPPVLTQDGKGLIAPVVFMKNQIGFQQGDEKPTYQYYPPGIEFQTSAADLHYYYEIALRWFIFLFLPLAWGMLWGACVLMIWIYAAITRKLAAWTKVSVDNNACHRLCAVALTPIVWGDALLYGAGFEKGLPVWAGLAIPFLFIYFGLRAQIENKTEQAT